MPCISDLPMNYKLNAATLSRLDLYTPQIVAQKGSGAISSSASQTFLLAISAVMKFKPVTMATVSLPMRTWKQIALSSS